MLLNRLPSPFVFTNPKFKSAPIELKLYAFFSFLITLLVLLLPISGLELWSNIVQITGTLPALGYMFGLFFIYAIIFIPSETKRKFLYRKAIVGLLAMHFLYGLFIYIWNVILDNNHNDNPFLKSSPWQPVWTMLLPLIWIIILMAPRVTKFCKLSDESTT